MIADKNAVTATRLFAVSIAMFGFGYALVPLYNVLCEVTGLNGKTGVISVAEADDLTIDADRLITVEFDTNINSRLEWEFTAEQRKMQVHPGKIYRAVFVAKNLSAQPLVGQAVPSLTPGKASLYFNKTECFCFSQQTLGPGESKQMPVSFVVDPDMPDTIRTLTLSYTFFPATEPLVLRPATATEPTPNS